MSRVLLGIVAVGGGCAVRVPVVVAGASTPMPPRFAASVEVVSDPRALADLADGTTDPAALAAVVRGPDAVDFTRQRVAVLQGSTGSWPRIAVRALDVADGIASIDACFRGGMSLAPTLATPWVAVEVPREVREVRWTCGEELLATRAL